MEQQVDPPGRAAQGAAGTDGGSARAGSAGAGSAAAGTGAPPERTAVSVAGDVRDPYPQLHAQRSDGPVREIGPRAAGGDTSGTGRGGGITAGPGAGGAAPRVFTVLGYQPALAVLRDAATFTSAGYAPVLEPVMGRTLLQMDAPEHPRQRSLVAPAFRARVVEALSGPLVRRTVDELLDAITPAGRAELVSQLTFPFPVRVIARLLGLPEEDYPQFQRWSLDLIGVGTDRDRGIAASAALAGYLRGVAARARAAPGEDLLSRLVTTEVDGRRLDDEEILSFLRLLLPAGAETTYRSSGSLLFALLTHPDQLARVRSDRALLGAAVEEGLRWEPPVMFVVRHATRDTQLAGVAVPAGSVVAVSLGAANRDPDRWPDPDRFDLTRPPQPHLAFGDGPHACLGTHLARLEMRVLLEAVLDRLPDLVLDPADADPHVHGMVFRSPTCLPVRFRSSPVSRRS